LDAPHPFGQAPIDGSLLGLHPAPPVPVVLEVLPVVFEKLDPRPQSPDRPGGPAGPAALETPPVEDREEEEEEACRDQIRANAVPVLYCIGDSRHDADHAQKTAHDPRQESSAERGHALFRSAGRGPVLPGGFGRHDYTIVICNGSRSKAQMGTECPPGAVDQLVSNHPRLWTQPG
jgi:hypothetical protein